MSAKRRQETIAKFSVPITDDDTYVFNKEDDDDFMDYDADDHAFSGKKNKGKGRTLADSPGGSNPKVMLLSLKSVRIIILLLV